MTLKRYLSPHLISYSNVFRVFLFVGLMILSHVKGWASINITYNDNRVVLENEKIKKVISLKENLVKVVSFYSIDQEIELLANSQVIPWFEFVINHKKVHALQPLWKYKQHSIREMSNNGKELKLVLQGLDEFSGLEVVVYQQLFSGSTLIREKIELQTSKGTFQLNKLDDMLHFRFPQYALKANVGAVEATEIRLATFGKEILPEVDKKRTYDDREWDGRGYRNLAQNHMFHSDYQKHTVSDGKTVLCKGPFLILEDHLFHWMITYEHASQDSRIIIGGNVDKDVIKAHQDMTIDANQGVTGGSELQERDDDFHFLGLSLEKKGETLISSVKMLKGGYLDGEKINSDKPYEYVWTSTSFYYEAGLEPAKNIINQYLYTQITEHPLSRAHKFYYNTWGMQRDASLEGLELRGVFTEKRILEEIRYAAELGVDLIVLDDGWEQTQGIWTPHRKRLPNGLGPLVDEMQKWGIKPGIWLSPMGINANTERYHQHPEWVIKGKDGLPIKAQWGHPAFDMVSGFYELFVADCKKLIDQGIRFFKWDAMNTFNSTLPNLDHGSNSYSPREIKERGEYLLPFYIVNACRELRMYNPEVVVEIDLTEPERSIVGLMPLQEAKFFWMNNGASGYNDYSSYRTKSVRSIITEFNGLIPLSLFTFAVYPHNISPWFSQRYNVNTTLIAGHGFWGDLKKMNSEQRQRVGKIVSKYKQVLPYIENTPTQIMGQVGTSPEIYTQVNREKAVGQIIGFSGSPQTYQYQVEIQPDSLLGVLNHAYNVSSNLVNFSFQFLMPDDTKEAFLLPNNGSGVSITSSTSWLDSIILTENNELKYTTGNTGEQTIKWPEKFGYPRIYSEGKLINSIKRKDDYFEICIKNREVGTVIISPKVCHNGNL